MDVTAIISTAFIMGAIGSLHCLGMCGPIAMALPIGSRNTAGRITGGVIYNVGRIITYSLLGFILGLAGNLLITPQLQGIISIIFGGIILLYLLLPSGLKKNVATNSPAKGFFLYLRKQLGSLLSSKTNRSLFGIGLLNGLLPCGMIYLALTSSFLAGTAAKGSLFMAAFGAGTFPAMLAVVFFGSYLNQQVRINFRRLIPVFLACMAVLLVLRGMNLGIRYVSPPVLQEAAPVIHSCQ